MKSYKQQLDVIASLSAKYTHPAAAAAQTAATVAAGATSNTAAPAAAAAAAKTFGGSFSASVGYSKVKERTESYQDIFTVALATCCVYEVELKGGKSSPPFHPDFKQAVIDLPVDYREKEYRNFVEMFGTHYSDNTQMGAMYGEQRQFKKKKYRTAWPLV
eukprot:TRINITY_DN3580_c0_g1_i1.p1 TRINITY_DN3580_c0_g1~~TRINITY_DN3580_c0_g1_i1.p1  ORF type:complete len:160 (+),score=35.61 TRINITY_DN3580_c0_g1_i1:63-542(+)